MRFEQVQIRNFRGITTLQMSDLQDMVVIAGPNGCGKSCVLDALRFLKSAYGGYQPNEWHHWMGEFQIAIGDARQMTSLFQDKTKELVIRAQIGLSQAERDYLKLNALSLLTQGAWRTIAEQTYGWRYSGMAVLGPQLRVHQDEVNKNALANLAQLMTELEQPSFLGQIAIQPSGDILVTESKVLEVMFGTYLPDKLGVLDYHGPQRMFNREQIGGVNLNLDASEQNLRNHALYNYINKYQNVKSELAAGYVSEVLAEKAGVAQGKRETLIETLKELFQTFFPDKEFLGPQPTASGTLEFPVRTSSGGTHDLNDLSSGEKEILYGYLRLRNAAPMNSVVLIDEPELHLNPRLTRGLPTFYHRHLGKALGNQIWLITHSDAILRQAVGQPEFSVFHMFPPLSAESSDNQIRSISADDLERAIIDLVGDLASYRPGSKLVIFEGRGTPGLDEWLVGQLFPTFSATINCISGEHKSRVRNLHGVLETSIAKGGLPIKIFSVVDRDSDEDEAAKHSHALAWDVYHIENYLLSPEHILGVLGSIKGEIPHEVNTAEKIKAVLRSIAEETLPQLVRHRISRQVNSLVLSTLQLAGDPADNRPAETLRIAIERSSNRLQQIMDKELNLERLKELEATLTLEYQGALKSDEWMKQFQGREILKRFTGRFWKHSNYELFRDLVVAKMRDAQYQPAGMINVLNNILAA
ncbi:AAA family ATPase [Dechloromonas sp. XY25]|uniref:AAA family ATPase n=1 Tax=Dechloromonas hankyongensis TaxID=2908002 RepID=A0ABS9K7K9_9RHOO|nr:AAA family ATPase [Dechloromonas hankyongensis]MCG2579128.1 AAA family ATPase [Dechloromonas hankyongensis]